MRKIETMLVTGGAGFIGSAFLKNIAINPQFNDTKKILIIDALTYAGKISNIQDILKDKRFEFIESDINDVNKSLSGFPIPNVIVNFAAESHVDRSIVNGEPFLNTNILGTYKLLEWARINNVDLFLQVSTDEVYGSIQNGSAIESSNLNPSSQYSASKAASDLIVLANYHTFGQPIVVTRCTNNYGPRQNIEKFIPKVITKAMKNEPISIYGTGENVRDWLYVDDHVNALINLLFNSQSGEIINISGNFEITNIDVAKLILRIMNKTEKLLTFVEDRKGHDLRYSLDSTKMRQDFNWKPLTNFETGIIETIKWFENEIKEGIEVNS